MSAAVRRRWLPSLAFFGCVALASGEGCPPVRWLTPAEGLPRDGVLAVSIDKDALARIGGLESGQASLRDESRGRVALERLESMGGVDGDGRLYVFRPQRELRAHSTYHFVVQGVDLPGLARSFRTSGGYTEFLVNRPPRVVHRRKSERGTVQFESRQLADAAWVTVELQPGLAPDTEGGDEQEFYRWGTSTFHRLVPTRAKGEPARVVLRVDPCQGGIRFEDGPVHRARFSLVSRHGFTTASSPWQLFRTPPHGAP